MTRIRVSEAAVMKGPTRFVYRPAVLAALARHGLAPTPTTTPQFLRDCLNDLYRYELRQLRDRVLRRELPHTELSAHVVMLRHRYPLMSLPFEDWILPPASTNLSD